MTKKKKQEEPKIDLSKPVEAKLNDEGVPVCPYCEKRPAKILNYDNVEGKFGWVWFLKQCECGAIVRIEKKM